MQLPECCCSDAGNQWLLGKEDGQPLDGAVVISQDESQKHRLHPNQEGIAVQAAVQQVPTIRGAEPENQGLVLQPIEEKSSEAPAKNLTAEEKDVEKARLQQLVNNFVKNAAKGCPCTYLKEVSGERYATRYFLDKRLEHLVVVSSTDATVAEVRCSISAIQDIYCLIEDGAGCFPAKVVGMLSEEEQSLLLMIVYRSDRGGTHRFCLLADNAEDRNNFLECLRILCIYMQSIASGQQNMLVQ